MTKACSPVVGSNVPVAAVPVNADVTLPGTEVVTLSVGVVPFSTEVVVIVTSCVVVKLWAVVGVIVVK